MDDTWDIPAEPLHFGSVPVGHLIFSPPDQPIVDQFLASTTRTLFLVAAAAGIGAVLLVLGLSRRILAPVEALKVAARNMAAGDLSQRVAIESDDEIGDLARAFNAMADGLARLEELRRNMVTDVAHELRTPLTNIRGYLEALRDGVVEQDHQMIDSLYDEAIILSRLVNDLQELSLAEAGQINLQQQPVALADVTDRVVEAVQLSAEAAGVNLRVSLPQDLPIVKVDPQRIGQVLRNLIDNGIAYTLPGGEVCVEARAGEEEVEVRVQDTGIGIADEDLPHIFERFYRADKSRSRTTGGAGLGLTIAKQLVEAHGGRIWVESTEDEGSVFVFTLPLSGESVSEG
jgi:signal transduction histidine kinase